MRETTYFRKKTILITGAASGIGKRFAEMVSEIAEPTLILWDRNPELLGVIAGELSAGGRVKTAGIDISDLAQIESEAANLISQNQVPDIIVNCAGIVIGKYFHEHDSADIEQTMRINTTGSMLVTRAFLNEMIKRGSGHIVNLASASGYLGNPKMSVYAASKWAVLGWHESLRLEMKYLKTGILTTAVVPSYINTGMFEGVKAPVLVPILETDDIVNRMITGIAKGKSVITAPFMVRFVPFLKAILPARAFDWVAGNVLGVYSSMDSFQGRKPKSL